MKSIEFSVNGVGFRFSDFAFIDTFDCNKGPYCVKYEDSYAVEIID